MEERTVQVALSTFNGEGYLDALVSSVLGQSHSDLRLLIRDDGSTDGTRELLAKYEDLPSVRVTYGPNLGVVHSFFALLQHVDPDVAYVAFCDQDDVWKPDKIERAVAALHPLTSRGIPALYCSDQELVDEYLSPLRSYGKVHPRPAFENALVQNIAPGCTMAFNRPAYELVVKEFPRHVRMHDWWVYQVISGLGEVIYDRHATILYRQQPDNVVGGAATPAVRWSRRVRRFVEGREAHRMTDQAAELLRIHGDALDPAKQRILRRFVDRGRGLPARVWYALTTELRRQTFLENVAFRLLVLLDRV